MRDRGFPLSGGKPIQFSEGDALWDGSARQHPDWTADQRLAIAIQADEFADAFFHRNGKPSPEELDSLLRTLYDLVHGL
jgi:hypothetical protein